MHLSTGSGKLSFAWKTLRAQWERAATEWSDAVRRDFEEQHLKPIEDEVLTAVNAIGTLGQVLVRAHQECE